MIDAAAAVPRPRDRKEHLKFRRRPAGDDSALDLARTGESFDGDGARSLWSVNDGPNSQSEIQRDGGRMEVWVCIHMASGA